MPVRHDSDSHFVKIAVAALLIASIAAIFYFLFWQSPSPAVYAPDFQPRMGRNAGQSQP